MQREIKIKYKENIYKYMRNIIISAHINSTFGLFAVVTVVWRQAYVYCVFFHHTTHSTFRNVEMTNKNVQHERVLIFPISVNSL